MYYAPLRLQIRPGKFHEPDLLLLRDAHDPCNQDAYWLGADLVVEIVSPDDPERDTEHGAFARGAQATSQLLAGFVVSVDEVFDAA